MHRSPFAPRRRLWPRLIGFVLISGLLLGVLAGGAVYVNAFGAGDQFESLVIRIEGLLAGPPPNRPTKPTVQVTAPPTRPTPRPSDASPDPSATPVPRVPVDVDVVDDHEAVFAHEVRKDWCAPAGVQMVLAIHDLVDTSEATQREIAGRVEEWESWEDSHNGRWGPAAMAEALAAYGLPGYEIHAYPTRDDAMRGAAVAIDATGSPAILLTWRGAHTWVMTGYRADADPTVFPDAIVEGAYILDPWYPWVSSIWGPSDAPGVFQDAAEMERNFLPWKRPEGLYPERDGLFIVLVPTIEVTPAAR